MNQLRLQIADQNISWPLEEGELPVAIHGGQLRRVDAGEDCAVRFCMDRRGIWLKVTQGVDGVHVNGRHVRMMAMLRPGDAIYVDAIRVLLMRDQAAPWPGRDDLDGASGEISGDIRVVLRGIGGQHHGRAFTLDRPRMVGSAADADVRIDDPDFAQYYAQLTLRCDHVVLRDLGSTSGTLLNGVMVRNALLQPGDQMVFDSRHRFVVEAPGPSIRREEPASGDDMATDVRLQGRGGGWRWPWLLLAALLIAGALALLLLFGTGA